MRDDPSRAERERKSRQAARLGEQLRAAYPPDAHADEAMQRLLGKIEALTTPKGDGNG